MISDGQFYIFFPFPYQYGNEIWKADGYRSWYGSSKRYSAGKHFIKWVFNMPFKNKSAFFAKSNGFDALELWSTDGSTEGTNKIIQLDF
ncbi:MAG: hypothetical protein IPG18_08610 [Saprospiraceae bacterium]|nr:hypothetical protein [Saprospiraceae bacterium]